MDRNAQPLGVLPSAGHQEAVRRAFGKNAFIVLMADLSQWEVGYLRTGKLGAALRTVKGAGSSPEAAMRDAGLRSCPACGEWIKPKLVTRKVRERPFTTVHEYICPNRKCGERGILPYTAEPT